MLPASLKWFRSGIFGNAPPRSTPKGRNRRRRGRPAPGTSLCRVEVLEERLLLAMLEGPPLVAGSFIQAQVPIGVSTDASGHVFVSHDSLQGEVVQGFDLSGQPATVPVVIASGTFLAGKLATLTANMAAELPSGVQAGDLLNFLPNGQIGVIRPSTGGAALLVNLRTLVSRSASPWAYQIENTQIYDTYTGAFSNFGGAVLPETSNYDQGDIAVFAGNGSTDLLVSGSSSGLPFVMRLRWEDGVFQGGRVLVSSRGQTEGGVLPPGVAVNSQGMALTTMPVFDTIPNPQFAVNVPIAFHVGYPEGHGAAPFQPFPLLSNAQTIETSGRVTSAGMTTDSQGNFLIAPSLEGNLINSRSGLFLATSDLQDLVFYPYSSSSLLFAQHDLSVTTDDRWLFVTTDIRGDGIAQTHVLWVGFPQIPQSDTEGWFTTGVFTANNTGFHLADVNADGAGQNSFIYGPNLPGWLPVAGDWDGDGDDTVGVYDPFSTTFYLVNENSATPGAVNIFFYGGRHPSWIPVAGDWDGDGDDTVGVFVPESATFYLVNENSATPGPVIAFSYNTNLSGFKPVAGDWDGDGDDTVGVFDPRTATFYLVNQNSATPGPVISFSYRSNLTGWWPVAGDWDGDGRDTIGVYGPPLNRFYLVNENSATPPGVIQFQCSVPVWNAVPIAGDWDGPSAALVAAGVPGGSSSAQPLTLEQVQAIADEAIRRWQAAGISASEASRLAGVKLAVADLPGLELGRAEGDRITLDADAAGFGWFVDATPADDAEFAASGEGALRAVDPAAVDRMDLLSVLEHELGHILGLEDVAEGVMGRKLQAGLRRLPVDAVFAELGG